MRRLWTRLVDSILGPANDRRVLGELVGDLSSDQPRGGRVDELVRVQDDLDRIEGAWTGARLWGAAVVGGVVGVGFIVLGALALPATPLAGLIGLIWGILLVAWLGWALILERRRDAGSRLLQVRLDRILDQSATKPITGCCGPEDSGAGDADDPTYN